ncbi:MAG: S-ribosylhomocysteine lyase [Deinococcota bacterium]|jgi:S-ribosylhomocysteine lyase|nr:S-ribosylhomocysteine lyase [Deinococcota bacterium]
MTTRPAKTVESFNLDHTKVRAPYLRLAGRYQTARGDEIRKFDLRLVQPNVTALPTAALHTIEHLMAGYLRERLPQLVDASPMGCRTGFYLTVLGEPAEEEVRVACQGSLQAIAEHDGPVPGCSERECGNYRDHSLHGAKAWARDILRDELIIQATIPLAGPGAT